MIDDNDLDGGKPWTGTQEQGDDEWAASSGKVIGYLAQMKLSDDELVVSIAERNTQESSSASTSSTTSNMSEVLADPRMQALVPTDIHASSRGTNAGCQSALENHDDDLMRRLQLQSARIHTRLGEFLSEYPSRRPLEIKRLHDINAIIASTMKLARGQHIQHESTAYSYYQAIIIELEVFQGTLATALDRGV